MTKEQKQKLSRLWEEYDANKLLCYQLRKQVEWHPVPSKMEELGAFVLWGMSLQMQLLQIYFDDINRRHQEATETSLEGA